MPRSLTLRQIEAFRAVIKVGTVSGAAEVLHISQPATSKLIAYLEEDTGLKLFDRVRGRLVPTAIGIGLYAETERLFSGLQQIEQAVGKLRRDQEGHLTIGIVPAVAEAIAGEIVDSFLRERPNIHVSVLIRPSAILKEWLATGQIDVAIISGQADSPLLDSELFASERLVCIMPKGHALSARREIAPADLVSHRFITHETHTPTFQAMAAAFERAKVAIPLSVEISTGPAVCSMVAGGLGMSIVHPLVAYPFRDVLEVRPLRYAAEMGFLMCRTSVGRGAPLLPDFVRAFQEALKTIYSKGSPGLTPRVNGLPTV